MNTSHDSDEERHGLGDGLALVALVVLDGDGPLLADPLKRGGAVESVLAHERLDVGKLPALHLPEGRLVLHEKLGALGGVLRGRDEVLDVGLLQVLQRVYDGEQLGLQERGMMHVIIHTNGKGIKKTSSSNTPDCRTSPALWGCCRA